MNLENFYSFSGTSYAGKSTMVHLLAEKYNGIECNENYHDNYEGELDPKEFPALCYTRDLKDWHDFIRRTPEEYAKWIADAKNISPCIVMVPRESQESLQKYECRVQSLQY